MEAYLGLLRQRHQRGGVVADDHGVTFGGVLEVIEHPFFFQQTLDEVEVRFAVLSDVGIALERLAQAKLMLGERGTHREHLGNDSLNRISLEDTCVEAVLQHGEPGVERCRVFGHAAVAATAGKAREIASDIAWRAIGQLDFDNHVLAHHRFQLDSGVLAHQQQVKLVCT
ncbi:hypothetical protein GSU75_05834 [Pseudomonas savastanoi pv. phaseolicola]|nr:hypothetical protein [Pseudomonas savastanoi pv. phaseolicola]